MSNYSLVTFNNWIKLSNLKYSLKFKLILIQFIIEYNIKFTIKV